MSIIKLLAVSKTGNEFSYYHSDHIGSSNKITDQAAVQIERLEYAPFGEVVINEGQNDLPPKKWTQRRVGISIIASS
ncbi:MAG: hypothetical protein HQL27_09945 [Candidatus Omnitrophica bacterium]|nr:hypothetical protein [Candidatus Omnitrophota bacterium]